MYFKTEIVGDSTNEPQIIRFFKEYMPFCPSAKLIYEASSSPYDEKIDNHWLQR